MNNLSVLLELSFMATSYLREIIIFVVFLRFFILALIDIVFILCLRVDDLFNLIVQIIDEREHLYADMANNEKDLSILKLRDATRLAIKHCLAELLNH